MAWRSRSGHTSPPPHLFEEGGEKFPRYETRVSNCITGVPTSRNNYINFAWGPNMSLKRDTQALAITVAVHVFRSISSLKRGLKSAHEINGTGCSHNPTERVTALPLQLARGQHTVANEYSVEKRGGRMRGIEAYTLDNDSYSAIYLLHSDTPCT